MPLKAVVDADLRFLHCSAFHPGGRDDAEVWGESELRATFEQGDFGDSCVIGECRRHVQ